MKFQKLGILILSMGVLTLAGFFPADGWLNPGVTAVFAGAVGPVDPDPRTEERLSGGAHRKITDMAGRKVWIPAKISKVLATSPPPATFIYMMAPEKLGGWFFSPAGEARKYIPEKFRDIPVIAWGRRLSNYEAYIAQHPDLVFVGYDAGTDPSRIDLTQEKFGNIPVVCMDNTRNAASYAETLRFVGEVLDVPHRAKALIAYYRDVLQEVRGKVSGIVREKQTRVYYAEKNNGLATDPGGSPHSQLIEICGGVNVADCRISAGAGKTTVTMESVLMWNPGVIITTHPEFVRHAYADGTWNKVAAVRNHRIYCAPRMPFNWFDRPPGINRIVGIPWTAHVLYPDIFPEEWLKTRVKTFFSLYYHYQLSDEELLSLMNA